MPAKEDEKKDSESSSSTSSDSEDEKKKKKKPVNPVKEKIVQGFCGKLRNPPKGVGGAIVQSLELKRNVSESRRGNKVFERAIEERQYQPGLSTMRSGRKIYYVNEPCPVCDTPGVTDTDGEETTAESNEFDSKLANLNAEFAVKCCAMKKLDAELAENQAKMALLDAELEKLGIIGEEAIEEACIEEEEYQGITDSECADDLTDEALDLLLTPSVQNLIMEIYKESGIGFSSGDDLDDCIAKCKKVNPKQDNVCPRQPQPAKSCRMPAPCNPTRQVKPKTESDVCEGLRNELKELCQPFCKDPPVVCDDDDEVMKQLRGLCKQFCTEKSSNNHTTGSSAKSSVLDDCIASCRCIDDCKKAAKSQKKPSQPVSCPPCTPDRTPRAPPVCPPAPMKKTCPRPAPKQQPPVCRLQKVTAPVRPPAPSAPDPLKDCLEKCKKGHEKMKPNVCQPKTQRVPSKSCPPPVKRTQSPAKSNDDAMMAKLKELCKKLCKDEFERLEREKNKSKSSQSDPSNNDEDEDDCIAKCRCIDDCKKKQEKKPSKKKTSIPECVVNPKLLPRIVQCDCNSNTEQNTEKPKCEKCPKLQQIVAPTKKSTLASASTSANTFDEEDDLETCIEKCKKSEKKMSSKPPLFSRLIDGKRCFPDISEISKADQTLYLAERDAYILYRRQYKQFEIDNNICCPEQPGEFEEYFYDYINGKLKIDIPICSISSLGGGSSQGIMKATKIPPPQDECWEKYPCNLIGPEDLMKNYLNVTKVEMDSVLQRNVEDLALDRPDRDPEILAILMNERIALYSDPLEVSELVTPHNLRVRLLATDVRFTTPGSMVPKSIPVHALNLINTHVLENVEAIIKSNELLYPSDSVAKEFLEPVNVIKPDGELVPFEDNYKCIIELHPFRVETFFQLRGANVPFWYPGMFTAYPDGISTVKLARSPSALITTAWRMCAP